MVVALGAITLESAAGCFHEHSLEDEATEKGEEDDHDGATDELGCHELPAEQHKHYDAKLDDKIRRCDHEHHGGDEVGTLGKERLRHGRRCIRAARRHYAVPRSTTNSSRSVVAKLRLHLLLRDECLDDTGKREAEDQSPERLPEHEEALANASPDAHEHRDRCEHVHYERTIRAMTAVASLILSSAP